MNERIDIENLIGEKAAQAGEPSVCREVEQQLAGHPWAQAKWHALMQENKVIRHSLLDVPVPDRLEQRLLKIADPEPAGSWGQRSTRVWAAAAAVLLITIGLAIVSETRRSRRMQTVALLAINNHLNHLDDHGVDNVDGRPAELTATLSEQVGFGVALPDFGGRLDFVGCRQCKLGTHTVAFSLWSAEGMNYSLFQFDAEDFGLPSDLRPSLIHTAGPAGRRHPGGAWIWSGRHGSFVLVGDPHSDLENLRSELEKY